MWRRCSVLASASCLLVLGVIAAPTDAWAQSNTIEEWVHMPMRILFASGSSSLDAQARAMLREVRASLAHRTDIVRIRLEGHTDTVGAESGNTQLATARAQAAVDFFTKDMGLPVSLFEVVGYGSTRPLVNSANVQNRRVEFSILVRRIAAP